MKDPSNNVHVFNLGKCMYYQVVSGMNGVDKLSSWELERLLSLAQKAKNLLLSLSVSDQIMQIHTISDANLNEIEIWRYMLDKIKSKYLIDLNRMIAKKDEILFRAMKIEWER